MDLSELSRPAVSCQCSRCFSSLAALENEWAKLSDRHAIAPGWMSVDLFRVSILPEQRRIPESSDLSPVRGRLTQDIRCRLCQQKLGMLCAMDNGPNILWKLCKISFREIVSMKTVSPSFKEGALERIMSKQSDDNAKRDTSSIPPGTSVQPPTLDQITNAQHLSTLHESMAELKHDFTSLRIKLDDPNQFSAETGGSPDGLVTTLLLQTELIGKLRREIEALTQENEALKQDKQDFKTGRADKEENADTGPEQLSRDQVMVRDSRGSDLLGGRKRSWADAFPNGRTLPIADSFESGEGDSSDAGSEAPQTEAINKGLEKPDDFPTTADTQAASGAPKSPIGNKPQYPPHERDFSHHQDRTIAKRARLSEPTFVQSNRGTMGKRSVGRPRKSDTATKPVPLGEQPVNVGAEQQQPTSPVRGTGRKRGRPPLSSQSKRGRPRVHQKSRHSINNDDGDNDIEYAPTRHLSRTADDSGQRYANGGDMRNGSEKENPDRPPVTKDSQSRKREDAVKKQRELTARRDKEVRIAMAQEEAQETREV